MICLLIYRFSIYAAVQMLVKYKIHRLPVIDSVNGNALHVITHKKLLKYIFEHVSFIFFIFSARNFTIEISKYLRQITYNIYMN